MAILSDKYPEAVETVLGPQVAKALARTSPASRQRLADVGQRFEVNGAPCPVDASDDDPVVDYGGSHPNESFTSTPIVNLEGSHVASVASKALGYTVTNDRAVGLLYAHSFIDAGASRYVGGLVQSTCPAVVVVAYRPVTDDVDFVLVDGSGASVLKGATGSLAALRPQLESSTRPRNELFDADPSALYSIVGTRLNKVPEVGRTKQALPYRLGDGLLVGAQTDRIQLSRKRKPDVVGSVSAAEQGLQDPPAGSGTRHFSATISRITDIQDSPYKGGADAPNGFVWGNPNGIGNCSRSNRDTCLTCCDSVMNGYAGAAATAVISGALAGVPAAGVGAVPGALVGGVIAGLLLIGGAVHTSLCRNDCHRLFDYNQGNRVDRQTLRLTAAAYDGKQNQIAYQVDVAPGAAPVVWSSEQVVDMAWGGVGFVAVSENGEEVPVSIIRRGNGAKAYYLRSRGDASVLNNLEALPELPKP